VSILKVYSFVTQYFSDFIFDKQDVDTLSRTFIPDSDVGNKSMSRCGKTSPQQWRNIEGVMRAICEEYGQF
jgi:hypothetical protein